MKVRKEFLFLLGAVFVFLFLATLLADDDSKGKMLFVKEHDKDGKKHMDEFMGTDEELQIILDWLGTLE